MTTKSNPVGKFKGWLRSALPGSRFTYHEGYLVNDRERDQDVSEVAKEAMGAWQSGTVDLVQERLGEVQYRYIAVKRRKR